LLAVEFEHVFPAPSTSRHNVSKALLVSGTRLPNLALMAPPDRRGYSLSCFAAAGLASLDRFSFILPPARAPRLEADLRSAATPRAGSSFDARPPKDISPRFASNGTRAAKLP